MKQNILNEVNEIRKMMGLVNEESNDGCDDLCEFMYDGECVNIEGGTTSERYTQEWYKQKKEQMPYYFNFNKDSRIKERWERYPDKNDPANFWFGIAMFDCEDKLDWFLNLEDPCKGKNPLCV